MNEFGGTRGNTKWPLSLGGTHSRSPSCACVRTASGASYVRDRAHDTITVVPSVQSTKPVTAAAAGGGGGAKDFSKRRGGKPSLPPPHAPRPDCKDDVLLNVVFLAK